LYLDAFFYFPYSRGMSDPSDRQGSGAAAGTVAGLVGPRYVLRLLRQAMTLRRQVLLRGPPACHRYSTSFSVPVQAPGKAMTT
jgi:hypothetical protein